MTLERIFLLHKIADYFLKNVKKFNVLESIQVEKKTKKGENKKYDRMKR